MSPIAACSADAAERLGGGAAKRVWRGPGSTVDSIEIRAFCSCNMGEQHCGERVDTDFRAGPQAKQV